MKQFQFILSAMVFISFATSCKKEIAKPDTPIIPVSYSDYPTNYLQIGNYWVYDDGDSTSIESFIVKGEADTFYRVVHHYANTSYAPAEYRRVTDEGLLIDTLGQTIFDYSGLPQVVDSSGSREMKCSLFWTPYFWSDTTSVMNTECCQLTGKWYKSTGYYPYGDCPDFCTANKGSFLVRGVGIVQYNYFQLCSPQSSAYKLLRFYVKH